MMKFILPVIGLVLGVLVDEQESWFAGLAAGGLVGWLLDRERSKRQELEKRLTAEVARLRETVDEYRIGLAELWEKAHPQTTDGQTTDNQGTDNQATESQTTESQVATDLSVPADDSSTRPTPPSGATLTREPDRDGDPDKDHQESARPVPAAARVTMPPVTERQTVPSGPSAAESASLWIRELLLGGNTVVRVGILVLLVGVTLLLKYAADHALFPIELRMASAAVVGFGLTLVGLRSRQRRAGFGQTLQGGGVATMYLVVFFSFRAYQLLPGGLAFALLAAIAVFSGVLAVVQDAMALVVIGQIGGFLAPVLASTGQGSHVALFSYYLLLNGAVLGVSWFRSWRPLNLIGFVFTFGISTAWGVLSYRPEHFASTEPFLIAFFLLYVAIPVLFALKGTVRGWVDGSLVFGAPLAFLGLQLALVRDIPFAMAYSAVGVAGLYVGLTRLLRQPAFSGFAAMRSSFLALGVGFGTLAIPYALDSAGLSAATWAVEGAGIYFLGIRQKRRLSRLAAVGLQLLAGGTMLLYAGSGPAFDALPFLNGWTLAAVFLAASSLFIAAQAHRHQGTLSRAEAKGLQILILWGLLFLIPMLDGELRRVVPGPWAPGARLASLGLLGLLLERVGHRAAWPPIRYAPATLGFALIPLLVLWQSEVQTHLLTRGGFFGWPLYFAALWATLRHFVPEAREQLVSLHPLSLWGLVLFFALLLSGLCVHPLELGDVWQSAAFGLAPVGALAALTHFRRADAWPLSVERPLYLGVGRRVLGLSVFLWTAGVALTSSGDDGVLGYLPLLNPGELVQLLALLALVSWLRSESSGQPRSGGAIALLPQAIVATSFLVWNTLLARTVHHYSSVPWDPDALWDSSQLQVAVSVSWTLIGLAVTVRASQKKSRPLWTAGATLLGIVVVKLFAVDLANLSTIAKIATFLVVGVLLLIVGYFSPVPPTKDEPPATPLHGGGADSADDAAAADDISEPDDAAAAESAVEPAAETAQETDFPAGVEAAAKPDNAAGAEIGRDSSDAKPDSGIATTLDSQHGDKRS